MFNTVKFTKPRPALGPYVVNTPMTAVANGTPQASFMMSKVIGSIKLSKEIDYKEVLKLAYNKINLIEHKPLTKEA